MRFWTDGGAIGAPGGALSSTVIALIRRIPLLTVAGLVSTLGFFILFIKSLVTGTFFYQPLVSCL
jgi:hypothetical protein